MTKHKVKDRTIRSALQYARFAEKSGAAQEVLEVIVARTEFQIKKLWIQLSILEGGTVEVTKTKKTGKTPKGKINTTEKKTKSGVRWDTVNNTHKQIRECNELLAKLYNLLNQADDPGSDESLADMLTRRARNHYDVN